ncbi:MAG: hypothetical protein KBS55_05715 [Bacteroidales bacterium]|nr:hypothetical protein [Candidatus Cryptobacteroides aphodequi]
MFRISRIAAYTSLAALLCCLSCIENDLSLGSGIVPRENQYDTFIVELPITDMSVAMADSLSGFNQQKMMLGSIDDSDYGLSSHACALTLTPMMEDIDWGDVQEVKSFNLYSSYDTVAVAKSSDTHILQEVEAYALEERTSGAFNSNKDLQHSTTSIIKGAPVLNGNNDLVLNFTDAFAMDVINKTNGISLKTGFNDYLDAFPGIYLKTGEPGHSGGRVNSFGVQLGFNANTAYISENYAALSINSIFDEEKGAVDTTFYFLFGMQDYYKLDSLLNYGTQGAFPQYACNITSHSTEALTGAADDKARFEGGAGLKPVIGAAALRDAVRAAILDSLETIGHGEDELGEVLINKASLILPYKMPSDYTRMDYYPARLSPTTRVKTDTTAFFMNLTDFSSTSENQGDINRSLCRYAPDITYHLQEMLSLPDTTIRNGNYDIWLMIMALETTTTTASASSNNEMNEYLQYLMYQNYYNQMYGGYGGYGGYGYGYGNGYSNYTSYMLAAMYASQGSNNTSTSSAYEIDLMRFYKGELCGPDDPDDAPRIRVTFSIHK